MSRIEQADEPLSEAVVAPDRGEEERAARAAVADFLKVVKAWQLKDDAARQLLGVSSRVLHQMKRGENQALEPDKLARILLVVGVFRGLNVLYNPARANNWVHLPNPNPMFEGKAPIRYMIKGGVDALVNVRQLLGVWSAYFPKRK